MLEKQIIAEITIHPAKKIDFATFMQQALYAPKLGYYSRNHDKFGRQGDFVTAPELTSLYGRTLAYQCQQILSYVRQGIILEFGAGSGKLALNLLTELKTINALPDAYYILELSAALKQQQQRLLQQHLPDFYERIIWLERWPEKPLSGIFIANEVLDAMPVHRFLQTSESLLESFIIVKDHKLTEAFFPITNAKLSDHIVKTLPRDYFPYCSEANLYLDGWFKACVDSLAKGSIMVIDYGFSKQEYYHPDRNQGTLMCHYRHQSHANPLVHIGEQDITAHVNFTQVAEAGQRAGLNLVGYCNQASFLLANGLLDLLMLMPQNQLIAANQAVKQLLQPQEMGELFKVIGFNKNISLDWQGFSLHNKKMSLIDE